MERLKAGALTVYRYWRGSLGCGTVMLAALRWTGEKGALDL